MIHPTLDLHVAEQANTRQIIDDHDHLYRNPTSTSAWHPKISPYRLIVLTTTIGLGMAKTLATQRGSTLAPITLEWVAGTVLVLLFFSISSYDSGKDVPSFLSWLFKPDCVELLWKHLGRRFSIPRPRYITEEIPTILDAHDAHRYYPPITPYRVLVSAIVVSFGTSKAVLGYYGRSTALTWVDWSLAVPITSFLYCIGLYEYNSSHIWWSFFGTKYSYSISTALAITMAVVLTSGMTVGSSYALWHISLGWEVSRKPRPEDYQITIIRRVQDAIGYDIALKAFTQECLAMVAVCGAWALLLMMYHIKGKIVAHEGVQRILRVFRDALIHALEKILRGAAREPLHSAEYHLEKVIAIFYDVFQMLTHISMHLFGIIVCITLIPLFVVFPFIFIDQTIDSVVMAWR